MSSRPAVGPVVVESDAEYAGELGGHPRAPEVPSACVGDLVDVDDTSDRGVAVAEQERDLVDAFASEQRT